jgi:hypothetical protein
MGAKEEWTKVFKAAVAVAKELRKKNPNLKFPQAMKQAWKDDKIKKMKDDFNKKHKGGAEGGAKRRRSYAKKSTAKRVKKTATKTKKTRRTTRAKKSRKTGAC